MAWRAELQVGEFQCDNLYIGTYPGVKIDPTELGYINGITEGTVTAQKAVVVDASKDIAGFNDITAEGSLYIEGAIIEVGEEGIQVGGLVAYGSPTGNVLGGSVTLHTGDDHDTTITHFGMIVTSDGLEIGPSTNPDMMTFQSNGVIEMEAQVYIGVDNTTVGRLSLFGSNGLTDGGVIKMYTQSGEVTIDHFLLSVQDDDLEIGPDTSPTSFRYLGATTLWEFNQALECNADFDAMFGIVNIGEVDVKKGILSIYGDPTASSDAGQLIMYTATDEVTYDYFKWVIANDFQLSLSTSQGNLMVFDPSTPSIDFLANVCDFTGGGIQLTASNWFIGGATVESSASELNILAGINATQAELDNKEFTVKLSDLSTGATNYIACPVAGTVIRVDSVVSGDPGGVSTTSLSVNGGAAMTATLVIANGAAAGERDTAAPADNNVVAVGDAIYLVNDATPINAVDAYVTVTVSL